MTIFSRSSIILAFLTTFILLTSCEGTLSQRMGKITDTVKKVDSAAVKVSKAATKFADGVEGYVDTTAYKKESTGIWHEKKEVKKQEKYQGGVFDSIFKEN